MACFVTALHNATIPGGAPCLVGEFGIPFDLNEREAYRGWAAGALTDDIWDVHVAALSAMYDALDALLLSSTQWNYTASNRNDAMVGDGWNQEDLSIWSVDQVNEPSHPDSGARALAGFCRPYVRAAPGRIVSVRWDGEATLHIAMDVAEYAKLDTEIYIPPWFQVKRVFAKGREPEWAVDGDSLTVPHTDLAGFTEITVTLIR